MIALGHGTVGPNELERAKAFYDALFESVGVGVMFEHPSGGRVYDKDGRPFFVVLGPYNQQAASVGDGSMHGFSFAKREDVDAFHAKARSGRHRGRCTRRASPSILACLLPRPRWQKLCAFKIG